MIKLLGLILILFTCTLGGFYKGMGLKKRCEKLNRICIALSKLSRFVSLGTGELEELIKSSFDQDILNDGLTLEKSFLTNEEIDLFDRLMFELGVSDRVTECKKIELYNSLFEKLLKSAEEDEKRLFKFYNSLGFLSGLAICIFII